MAASSGKIGKGTTLGYSTTEGGTYTLVAELIDVKPPKGTTDRVEFTHYTSDSDRKEYKPGWKDAETATFECNYVAATVTALTAIEGLQRYWKVTLPGGAYWTWQGTLGGLETSVPIKDRITLSGEITCDSDLTWAAA